jgi:hypothetical protein
LHQPPASFSWVSGAGGFLFDDQTTNQTSEMSEIPDSVRLSGNTPDGRFVSVLAGELRQKPANPGPKVFIGIPIYKEVPSFFMQSLLALQHEWPFDNRPAVEVCQGDGVARSRNQLTAAFLRSDCTHLMFIDCDLVFNAAQVLRLIDHDLPVVGGLYPKKQDGKLEWVINTLPQQGAPEKTGLCAVKYVGTGFMCIKREVFEAMRDAYPDSRYRADYGNREMEFDFWPMSVYRKNQEDEGRYLSEDWYFCQRWLDMGGKIYADSKVLLRHVGTAIYPLQAQQPLIFADPEMRIEAVNKFLEGMDYGKIYRGNSETTEILKTA